MPRGGGTEWTRVPRRLTAFDYVTRGLIVFAVVLVVLLGGGRGRNSHGILNDRTSLGTWKSYCGDAFVQADLSSEDFFIRNVRLAVTRYHDSVPTDPLKAAMGGVDRIPFETGNHLLRRKGLKSWASGDGAIRVQRLGNSLVFTDSTTSDCLLAR